MQEFVDIGWLLGAGRIRMTGFSPLAGPHNLAPVVQ
jgi:hypothetical protein